METDKRQGGFSTKLKFAEINKKSPRPCMGKFNRNRESVKRSLSPRKRKLLSLIRREADENGTLVKPLRFYAEALRVTRYRAKELIYSLQSDGYIKIKTAFEGRFVRIKIELPENGGRHESKN